MKAQERYLDFPDADIHVWAEQGSLSLRTKIYLGLLTVVNGISHFDGVVGGLEKIYSYSTKAMNYITTESIPQGHVNNMEVKRSAGFPEKVDKILRDVKYGKLTVEEGRRKVINLLDKEPEEQAIKDQFLHKFKLSAESIYDYPMEQLYMFPEEESTIPTKPSRNNNGLPKKAPAKATLQGVEIWFDQKTGRKRVRKYVK